jgi:hypothetical protein
MAVLATPAFAHPGHMVDSGQGHAHLLLPLLGLASVAIGYLWFRARGGETRATRRSRTDRK